MSSPRTDASLDGSATQPTPQTTLEADLALLTNLLSQDESNPADVAELLRRLEAAEGLADGVESRLDGIIDNLDNLLNDLETKQVVAERAGGGGSPVEKKGGVVARSEGAEKDIAQK